jgi:outer membrane protein OmpA-like peptidoglycan-associated protein
MASLERQDEGPASGGPTVQRQGQNPPPPAIPPTFQLSPSALTVGMGERITLNAYIDGVTNTADLGGIASVSSSGVRVPNLPSAARLLRRRRLTFYASASGTLTVSFDYRGQNVTSNTVHVTVRDPTFQITPETAIVDKGGGERFAARVQGVYDRQELGGSAAISTEGIEFSPSPPLIERLHPSGTFEAHASEAGAFHLNFSYFSRSFDSNEVGMAVIEPSIHLETEDPYVYVGREIDVSVSMTGIGDPTQLGHTVTTYSPGVEVVHLPPVEQLVSGGNIRVRLTQAETGWVQFAAQYMGEMVGSDRLPVNIRPPEIVVSPTQMSVGTRQKFPVRYRLHGFVQPDQVTGTVASCSAPASIVESVPVPTQPEQEGEVVLEANNAAGSGVLVLGVSYLGQTYESAPVQIQVTTGPTAASTPDRVFFDTDQATIRPDAAAGLALVAARLRAEPNLIARLEGHADTRYTDEYNAGLSMRRALAVRSHLIQVNHTNPDQVPEGSTIGWGESFPLVSPETNPAEFQTNRRVEIILVENPSGRELAPTVHLSPRSMRVGVGQRFSLRYAMGNVHDADQFGGSSLTTGTRTTYVGGEMPHPARGQEGTLTLQAGPEPGQAPIQLSIDVGGTSYSSEPVQVEIVAPSVRLSPERQTNLAVGQDVTINYVIDDAPDPTAYGGHGISVSRSSGGNAEVVGGAPGGLTGGSVRGSLQLRATEAGETQVTLSLDYGGRTYPSNPAFLRIFDPARVRTVEVHSQGGAFYITPTSPLFGRTRAGLEQDAKDQARGFATARLEREIERVEAEIRAAHPGRELRFFVEREFEIQEGDWNVTDYEDTGPIVNTIEEYTATCIGRAKINYL